MKKLIPVLFFFTCFAFAQDRIVNGDFESGTDPWAIEVTETAAGTYNLDNTSPISGTASGHVTVDAVTGTGWHLQFFQSFGAVEEGKRLHFTFKIRASANVS